MIRPTREIEKMEIEAAILEATGSQWPGMSYEAGVAAALRWVLEEDQPSPLDD